MKTTIDENGCNTHLHGDNILEVKIPLTVNGINVITNLQELNEKLNSTVLELNTKLLHLEQTVKTLEEKLFSVTTTISNVENVESAELTTPTTAKAGRKSSPKSNTLIEQV